MSGYTLATYVVTFSTLTLYAVRLVIRERSLRRSSKVPS
jgi:hypothetical protein